MASLRRQEERSARPHGRRADGGRRERPLVFLLVSTTNAAEDGEERSGIAAARREMERQLLQPGVRGLMGRLAASQSRLAVVAATTCASTSTRRPHQLQQQLPFVTVGARAATHQRTRRSTAGSQANTDDHRTLFIVIRFCELGNCVRLLISMS